MQNSALEFNHDISSSSEPSFVFHSQGMVYSAEYIKKKLEQEMILSQAFGRDLVPDTVYFTKIDSGLNDYFP